MNYEDLQTFRLRVQLESKYKPSNMLLIEKDFDCLKFESSNKGVYSYDTLRQWKWNISVFSTKNG